MFGLTRDRTVMFKVMQTPLQAELLCSEFVLFSQIIMKKQMFSSVDMTLVFLWSLLLVFLTFPCLFCIKKIAVSLQAVQYFEVFIYIKKVRNFYLNHFTFLSSFPKMTYPK